jgi:hypothetical protein
MRRRDIPSLLVSAAASSLVDEPRAARAAAAIGPTIAERAAGAIIQDATRRPGEVERYLAGADATGALIAAIAQAQQVSGGAPIGAPVSVSSDLELAGSLTVPAAQWRDGNLIKATVALEMRGGSLRIASDRTLTIEGTFTAPRVTCFRGEGAVVFGAGSCVEAYPEWWGARADSAPGAGGTIRTQGTDSTRALNAALLACAGGEQLKTGLIPLRLAAGYYLCGNVTLYPASCVRGAGREVSGVLASREAGTGAMPYWWSDSGDAAKIVLEDFAFYGCYAVASRVHTLCRLGYGSQPFGTEGYLRGLWFRDAACAGGGWALDLQSNVGFFDLITIYGNNRPGQNLLRLSGGGGGNMLSKIALVAAGPDCCSFECNGPSTVVEGLEIEAPGSPIEPSTRVRPLYLGQNTAIQGLTLSGADGITLDAWIELGAHCTTWSITGVKFFFGRAGSARVINGNVRRADGSYFGGQATGVGEWRRSASYREGDLIAHRGAYWKCTQSHIASAGTDPGHSSDWTPYCGPYSPLPWSASNRYDVGSLVTHEGACYIAHTENVRRAPPDPALWRPYVPVPTPYAGEANWSSETRGQRPQCFTLQLRNTGQGRLQHRIVEPGGSRSSFASAINGAAFTFVPTPAGADDSTIFLGGGKIGSASPHLFWLDTADQSAADTFGMACITQNTVGTPLIVAAAIMPSNIGGVQRHRLCLGLHHASTGAPFALTPGNFGGATGSAGLDIAWMGALSD